MINPQKMPNLVSQPMGDGLAVFDPLLQKSYLLNATSAFVFQHCDGATTPQQLTQRLRQKFNMPGKEADQMMWLALNELEKANLLQGKMATTQAPQPILTRRQALNAFAAAGLSIALLPIVSQSVALQAAPLAQAVTPSPSPAPSPSPSPTPTPAPVQINSQLSQVSFSKVSATTTPDSSYPAKSTAGVLVARLTLRNNGAAVNRVYYQVKTLNNGNFLLNANSAPGQVGAQLSVANSSLPGGNSQWNSSEQLSQDFRIGVMVAASVQFRVDVYAASATVMAAGATDVTKGEWLGSFLLETDLTAPGETIHKNFLPLVNG